MNNYMAIMNIVLFLLVYFGLCDLDKKRKVKHT